LEIPSFIGLLARPFEWQPPSTYGHAAKIQAHNSLIRGLAPCHSVEKPGSGLNCTDFGIFGIF
jgi:hypothetical protein